MRFAEPLYLLGLGLSVIVAGLLSWGAAARAKAAERFGQPERLRALTSADPAKRRAWKGVLLVAATALAFLAAARPQYGKGSRLIPATNLDVIVVLDFSKSMWAKDVEPSRTFRAKGEVARLVKELEGARFGAVAFAGEPMGFPLTADGAAVAQFLRNLDPNDMPVGGTAIARALEQARELLHRDPKAAEHKRVILLITDGEDLEGDPVAVAQRAGAEGTTLHVVQIGGREPVPIPDVGPDGKVIGWRTDRQGNPLTTELSESGEAQLKAIAESTPGGQLLRSEKGSTGIDAVRKALKAQMKGELAEKVETVYADVYAWPLGLALLVLLLEAGVSEARRSQGPGRALDRATPSPAQRPVGRSS